MYISHKEKSLINSLAVSANLLNTLRSLPKIISNSGRIRTQFTTLLFHPYEQKVDSRCHINQICGCPNNT